MFWNHYETPGLGVNFISTRDHFLLGQLVYLGFTLSFALSVSDDVPASVHPLECNYEDHRNVVDDRRAPTSRQARKSHVYIMLLHTASARGISARRVGASVV